VEKIEANGWEVYYHPEFEKQFSDLESQVEKLSGKLAALRFERQAEEDVSREEDGPAVKVQTIF
jgi:hypothetical protein